MNEKEILKERFKSAVSSAAKVISEKLERDQNTYTQNYQNKNYYVQEIAKTSLSSSIVGMSFFLIC